MLAPSGDQYEISAGGYRAVVTESGGTLRVLEHEGRPLLDGFPEDQMAAGGRGQQLVPWPNRLRDGAWTFGGHDLQLPLSEPARHNASHGLVRWVAWSVEEHTPRSVALTYRLMAQTGYPWTLDLHVVYDLSADGLTVTQSATNLAAEPAPYASGAHPYLAVGPGPVDGWELTLPAATRLLVDDRLLPVGRETWTARRTTSGSRGRSATSASTTGSPTWCATPTAPRPSWSPTVRPVAGRRCGSTASTAGSRSSAPTTSPAPPAGRWPSSR